MVSNYVANSKTTARWCDRCGTLVLGNACGCGSEIRSFQINSPGDVRPAMGKGRDLVLALLKENFGTDGGLSDKAIFLNKIPGEDRSDEVIAHGEVIAVIRFEVELNRFSLELRQAGAELLKDMATTNVVVFGNMSGHLKGKSVPGANIREIKGDFEEGAPLLLIKGGKVGPGTAYVSSKEMRDAEKAFRIKDLNSLTNMPLSPDSDRKRFISANLAHLRSIESNAASDIRSFIKDKKQPVTSSFSGGKDSLAALGVLMKVKKDPELLFVDTGLEFPETVAYVDDFVKKHRLRLHRAEAGDAFWKNVGAFGPPAKDFRWCCKVCKLGPITDMIAKDFPKGTITIEGNRMLESFSRSKIGFVSKNPFVPNQTNLNPIRTWTSAEVWGYIWMRGLEYNPMYDRDFERIGCYLCASCLSSEWRNVEKTHPKLYKRWEDHLLHYAKERSLPKEYVDMGFWRWKVMPPKMVRIAEERNLHFQPSTGAGPSMKVLKGASSCAAGGFSMEAVVTVPRSRDFSSVAEALRTVGEVKYSDDFEIALVKTKAGTAKLFGGGQVSVTSKRKEDAEPLFERSVKSLLRAQMCTSCGICAKKCARRAIKIKDGFHVDPNKCNSCGRCESSCMVSHYYDKII